MTPSAEAQSAANVRAWMRRYGLRLPFTATESDRVWLPRDFVFELRITELCAAKVIEERDASNHGSNVEIGYRECVSRCAAQIVVHRNIIEIDFDLWQPWDVIGWFGHGWEVVRNKLGNRKTDPFEVSAGLKKRMIYADFTA